MTEISYLVQILKKGKLIAKRRIAGQVLPRKGETFSIDPYQGPTAEEIRAEAGESVYINSELEKKMPEAIETIKFHTKNQGQYRVLEVRHPSCAHFYIHTSTVRYFSPDFDKNFQIPLLHHTPTRALIPEVQLEKIVEERRKLK